MINTFDDKNTFSARCTMCDTKNDEIYQLIVAKRSTGRFSTQLADLYCHKCSESTNGQRYCLNIRCYGQAVPFKDLPSRGPV